MRIKPTFRIDAPYIVLFWTQNLYRITRFVLGNVTIFLLTVPFTVSVATDLWFLLTNYDNRLTFNWLIFHSKSQNQAKISRQKLCVQCNTGAISDICVLDSSQMAILFNPWASRFLLLRVCTKIIECYLDERTLLFT